MYRVGFVHTHMAESAGVKQGSVYGRQGQVIGWYGRFGNETGCNTARKIASIQCDALIGFQERYHFEGASKRYNILLKGSGVDKLMLHHLVCWGDNALI